MSANTKTIRAELRTQFQRWVKKTGSGKHATIESLTEMLMSEGGIDRELIFQSFGRDGFTQWLRKQAGRQDPTTGRPTLTMVGHEMVESEDGVQKASQRMLFVPTKWANFDGRVFDFRQKVASISRDRRACRIQWQGIAEDFPDDVRREGAYKPPSYLFDSDECDGDEG